LIWHIIQYMSLNIIRESIFASALSEAFSKFTLLVFGLVGLASQRLSGKENIASPAVSFTIDQFLLNITAAKACSTCELSRTTSPAACLILTCYQQMFSRTSIEERAIWTFFVRTIIDWNHLEDDIVDAPSTEAFLERLVNSQTCS